MHSDATLGPFCLTESDSPMHVQGADLGLHWVYGLAMGGLTSCWAMADTASYMPLACALVSAFVPLSANALGWYRERRQAIGLDRQLAAETARRVKLEALLRSHGIEYVDEDKVCS
jgi:hypothetical protein